MVSSLEGDAAGVAPGTVDVAGIMFNNYTKNVVQDEQSNAGDARNEDERTRPAAKRNRKSRGSDAGTSAPSSARSGSKRPRPGSTGSNASATSASLSRPNSRSNSAANFASDEPLPDASSRTASKRPRQRKRKRRAGGKKRKSQSTSKSARNKPSAKLLSVDDMFKLGFGRIPRTNF